MACLAQVRCISIVAALAAGVAEARSFRIGERIDAELAIQAVYDRHRRDATSSGAAPAPSASPERRQRVAGKVEVQLARAALLGSRWRAAVTSEDVQRELERMVRSSRDPEVLDELLSALGRDPSMVAECLVRPLLVTWRFDERFSSDPGIPAGTDPDRWLWTQEMPAGWREPADDGATFTIPGRAGICEASPFHPRARWLTQGAWTGSSMVIWGGYPDMDEGGRYDPVADAWRPVAGGAAAPSPGRYTTVWTGTEVVLWDGATMEGARYDPDTDTFRSMAQPSISPRGEYSAVWSGQEMIVWGGQRGSTNFDTGARYDPILDRWTTIGVTSGTPERRTAHLAVWTGTEMIVWGGHRFQNYLDTGGRYDPVADAWRPTAVDAATPTGRSSTPIWTGTEMIVWGGGGTAIHGDGSRYDPVADRWTSITASGAPAPRHSAAMAWTGTRMIVWGGDGAATFDDGATYDPQSDSWAPMARGFGLPSARAAATVVWTGTTMIVWGGVAFNATSGDRGGFDDGGIYDPALDRWRPIEGETRAPSPRAGHTSLWTGAEMLVWGGSDNMGSCSECSSGGRYDPALDAWTPTSRAGAPSARTDHTAVWSGREMIVWGGWDKQYNYAGDGARYDPALDAWTPLSATSSPAGRRLHSAVWTGSEMIVWGGERRQPAFYFADGGRYDPATDSWTPLPEDATSPPRRCRHTAIWTGSEMIVWGGADYTAGATYWDSGGCYDPATGSWRPTALGTATPSARLGHTSVWSGVEMIVWGGEQPGMGYFSDGGRYDPVADSWRQVAPLDPRIDHTAVWTGSRMIVWGGSGPATPSSKDSGGRYDPLTDSWTPTSLVDAPRPRAQHTATWTARSMIVWGGWEYDPDRYPFGLYHRAGGIYEPLTDSWACPLPGAVLAGKGPGPSAAFDSSLAGYRADGSPLGLALVAFPSLVGAGAKLALGDVDEAGPDEILAAPGPIATHPPQVRGFASDGTPEPGLDFFAFGTGGYGANVARGAIDGGGRILAGPGPSSVFGPHVRAFRYAANAVAAIAKVSFFAYGTPRFGVLVAGADIDADRHEEIATGAGPGVVFGPHVRAFDYDGIAVAPVPGVSFYAYGTLRYGVEIGRGDVDGDGRAELLTGPGPSPVFPAQLRGFRVSGAHVQPVAGMDAVVFPGTAYGLVVGAGPLDGDAPAEIGAGPGPDPAAPSRLRTFDYDGATIIAVPPDADPFGLGYGLRLAVGTLGS